MGEIAFEHGAVEYAERRGWLVRKMRYIGRNGCPDRWFFKDGIVVPIEFKGPKGQRSQPLASSSPHRRSSKAPHGAP